ncbi:putative non-specific serine/threonine protein kinase [Helianthus debilis subsp. tardiflorus]
MVDWSTYNTNSDIVYIQTEYRQSTDTSASTPVTCKADVFSYGMVLFELVYGKRNAEQSGDSGNRFFPSLVANVLMTGGDILSLLDVRLNREASVEQITKICKVACWCIQDEEDSRPSMSLVEQILEGVSDVNMPPVPQMVKLYLDNTEPIVFFTESSSNGSAQVLSNSSSSDYASSSSTNVIV